MNLENYHPSVKRLIHFLPGIWTRYYHCNFYLVGSAQSISNPRDIDIVVDIPDDLFLNMYGDIKTPEETIETWSTAVDRWFFNSNIWKMWSWDIGKQGKELTFLAKKQVDFKTQPSSYFKTIDKQRTLIEMKLP